MTVRTTSPEFFEAKYKASQDPWHFASSASEQSRYKAILEALGSRHYRRAFEPACSIGVLTEQLAAQCEQLLAVDLSATAAARAAERCAHLTHVTVRCGSVESFVLAERVDLLILSEIGYYFTDEQWHLLVGKLLSSCAPDCTILACHWLGTSADHEITGDQVHASLRAQPSLILTHEGRYETFRLDRFSVVQS